VTGDEVLKSFMILLERVAWFLQIPNRLKILITKQNNKMKQILIALTMVGFAYCSANAQERVSNQVCRFSKNGVSCYKTKYAENFKVCQDDFRYYICGETPTYANSTHPALPLRPYRTKDNITGADNTYAYLHDNDVQPVAPTAMDMTAPQSQSYPANTGFGMSTATSYEGYYPKKNYIKVCYVGNNVAEENLNPYRGCASPMNEAHKENNPRKKNEKNQPKKMPVRKS
jgi:hypothetical protein